MLLINSKCHQRTRPLGGLLGILHVAIVVHKQGCGSEGMFWDMVDYSEVKQAAQIANSWLVVPAQPVDATPPKLLS